MASIVCIANIALAALLVLSTGALADAPSSSNDTTCDYQLHSSGINGFEIINRCWVWSGTDGISTSSTNQNSKTIRTSGLGQTSDTEETDSFWIDVGIIVVASVPVAALVILNYIKCGMIVDDETRRKQNNRFTWNVAAIAVFNMVESTAQATLHVYMGISVFQNIKPDLYPKAGLFNVASLWHTTWQCIAMLLSADFFMYFLHRSYHQNKWLYRNLHCIHHEYRQVEHPIWCLFYVHPLELFLDNLAFFSGMHIMPTTMFNIFVYGTVSGLYSAAGHSGVLLPCWADRFLDTSSHQLHHSKWRCNYGEHFTLIDRLFGTYVAMPEKHKELRRKQQRHAAN